MKIIFRFCKALLIIMVIIISIPFTWFEALYYGIRWIFTGKEYPDYPLFLKLMLRLIP